MWGAYKLIYVFLLLFFWFGATESSKNAHNSNVTKEHNGDNVHHHQNKQHDGELPHKLETAPIPAVHSRPQPENIQKRAAPIALDHRYDSNSKNGELDRVNRHISNNNSPNPQRPERFIASGQQENKTCDDSFNTTHFNHPGRTQISGNHPANTYNYYRNLNIYGSAYDHASNQPLKSYRETANIGIIPPKNVNAKIYYNNISGLKDVPVIGEHDDSFFQALYANQKYPTYRYGYENRHNVKNAYKNVLTGLAMWSIMNGLTNRKHYTIYNHKTLPQNFSRDIMLQNDTITPCLEDVTVLCQHPSEPLCVENGTTFCITSEVVSCLNERLGDACVNVSTPCEGCEGAVPMYLPCVANITVYSGEIFNKSSGFTENVFCVITLIVPREKELSGNSGVAGSTNVTTNTTESKIGNK